MLKLTKTVEYALISMNYIENNGDDKPIPAKLIANQFSIPEELLAKILQKLVKHDILESIRGSNGGYKIKDSTGSINLISFIESLEGPIGIVDCTVTDDCSLMDFCNIRKPINNINNNIRSIFEKTTLKDIIKGI
tara:strand:- start:810 stop:1214 length:405 start_codon:yes stop_codon:yes gene_type:complete